ncbi:hypothetical protein [Pseudosulfitobacter sp. SM2401]|uniref:hypothetical protein n=1 Tax=Pseudosulfitobacter sp. SM2401 TaxID=3350098 RepID=UPI0036F2516B
MLRHQMRVEHARYREPVERRALRAILSIAIGIFISVASLGLAQEAAAFSLREISTPVGPHAREPSLTTLADDRVVMSWTEDRGADAAVRMALLEGSEWSPIRTIHQSRTMFVNWADFPSVVALSDGTLAAHWLELNGPGSYQYDVNIAFSSDEGRSWTAPMVPHDDRSQREHGFVSCSRLNRGADSALVGWARL